MIYTSPVVVIQLTVEHRRAEQALLEYLEECKLIYFPICIGITEVTKFSISFPNYTLNWLGSNGLRNAAESAPR